MKQKMKKACAVTMLGTLLVGSAPIYQGLAASKTLKVNTRSVTLTVGKTKVLTANMNVTFKTSNKKVVSLKSVKKKKCTLVAKKKGSCTITVKAKNQKTIKVKVKVKNKDATTKATVKPTATVSPAVTATVLPTATVTPQETEVAKETETPQQTEAVKETETPQQTEAAKETEVPQQTEVGKETEVPQQTEAGKETEVPQQTEEARETETPLPEQTEEAKETKTPLPEQTEEAKETETPLPEQTEEAKETETPLPEQTEETKETEAPLPENTDVVKPTETPIVTGSVIVPEDTDTMGGKVNNLGYNLSGLLDQAEEQNGNRVISSYSILMALTMLDNAADGETKAELEKTLGITDLSAWNEEFGKHLKLNCNDEIKDHETETEEEAYYYGENRFAPELSSANSLWYNDTKYSFDSEIQKNYMEELKENFLAECRALDFSKDTNPVHDVNKWVEEKTNQKIRNLLSNDFDADSTGAVLVNTLYFNGCWQNKFDKESTRKLPFYGKDNTTEVDTMRQFGKSYAYYEQGELMGVELPFYGNSNLVMDVITTKDKEQNAPALYEQLSNTEKNQFYRSLGESDKQLVDLYLPKFKLEYGSVKLKDYLEALGIRQAFDSSQADFPKLRGENEQNIYADEIVHKAVIEVGEMGATAAAATAVIMETGAAPYPYEKPTPIEFKADHPFVFAIRDKKTNMIYFMGQIETLSENG